MPTTHSELYRSVVKEGQEAQPIFLNAQEFANKVRDKISYEDISDVLREANDAQFNIVSTLNDQNEWVRDATQAFPLDKRISHDAPVLNANNALLRCLSRLRPIDYAIDKKLGNENNGTANEIRNDIRKEFAELSQEILTIAENSDFDNKKKQAKINQKEKQFNTFLVKMLHEANLTYDCENQQDAEKLLFHYRNLSSVLSPARTMITLTYDSEAKILQRETQYPVTKKTTQQQETLNQFDTVNPYPAKDEINAHTSHREAVQEADHIFRELLKDDNTALPGQSRKTHLVGAKNAFIVKNELIKITEENIRTNRDIVHTANAENDDILWLGRMGSPVFIGKGEKSDAIQIHTRENLQQVRTKAAELMEIDNSQLKLHVTTLNTSSPLENQSTIIDHLYKATRERENNNDDVSYAPTNIDGTCRVLDIAPTLLFKEHRRPSGSAPLQKTTRVESVANIMLTASTTENTLSVVNCASGQDRTGTAVEKSTQEWMKKRYIKKGLDTKNIASMRAQGGNAAEITTHHVHGSPGMKADSKARNVFGQRALFSPPETKELYRLSAKTNKKNHLNAVDFLKKPGKIAIDEYQKKLAAFKKALDTQGLNEELKKQGDNVLNQIEAMIKDQPEKQSSRNLNDLIHVLHHAKTGLEECKDQTKTVINAKKLASLSQHVAGKSSSKWKALGFSLLTFACAALVAVGILAAIPSGGSSLLLTAIGLTGLGLITTAGIGAGVVTAAGVAGGSALYYGRTKNLAKAVTFFHEALLKESKGSEDREDDDQPLIKS